MSSFNDTSELIIQKLDVANEYLGMGIKLTSGQPSSSGWLECHAFGREDSHPSAAINVKTGRYKDHGGEGVSLSLWDFAAQFGGFPDYIAARKAFAEKVGVPLGKGRSPKRVSDQLLFDPAAWNEGNRVLLKRWADAYQVNPAAVIATGCRVVMYPAKSRQFKCLAFPVFGAPLWTDGDPIGWILQNISPAQKLPKWGNGGEILDWLKRKTIGPIRGGLLNFHALSRLEKHEESIIWKVEGVSDMLSLMSAAPADKRSEYLVVSNAGGATEDVLPDTAALFTGHRVGLIFDNDTAGQIGAMKWATALVNIAECVKHVKLRLPAGGGEWVDPEVKPSGGTDLRDWLNLVF